MKKILNILIDIFFVALAVVSLIITINTISKGYFNFFGYSLVNVQSGSMTASGIVKGGVYIIKGYDSYGLGDVIAYRKDDIIIFHEIVKETADGFITKGSSNYSADSGVVEAAQIIGRMYSTRNVSWFVAPWFRIMLIAIIYVASISYIASAIRDVIKEYKELEEREKAKALALEQAKQKSNKDEKLIVRIYKDSSKISKTLSLILFAILLTLSSVPARGVFSATNQTVTVENVVSFTKHEDYFSYDEDDPSTITSYDNSSGEKDIIVPSIGSDGTTIVTINSGVFYNNTTVETITIPSSVTRLGWLNFLGCSNLKALYLYAEDPITQWYSAMSLQLGSDVVIYVPDSAVETYKKASGWKRYASQIQPMSNASQN